MSPVAEERRMLRIGEVASEVGTTPRTIRYYEEIGLLPAAADRPSGGHRNYTTADVEREGARRVLVDPLFAEWVERLGAPDRFPTEPS